MLWSREKTSVKISRNYRYGIYGIVILIGVLGSVIISAVPGGFVVPALDRSPSSTKFAFPQGGSGGQWIDLNSSVSIDAQSYLTGNITFPKYTAAVSSNSPIVYFLSPSNYANWVKAPSTTPASVVTAQTDVINDLGNQVVWVTFSFTTTETGYLYFLGYGSFPNYSYYPGSGPTPVLNVAVHKSSISAANTIITLLMGIPPVFLIADDILTSRREKKSSESNTRQS